MRRTAKAFSKNTGVGGDGIQLSLIAAFPDSALEELGKIMKEIVERVAWPSCLLVALLALIPKKSGGSRSIVVM